MFSPGTQCQNLVEFLDTSVSLGKLLMWRIAGQCGENLHPFGAQQEVVCMSSKEDSQERRTQWGRAMFFQPRRWKTEVFPETIYIPFS